MVFGVMPMHGWELWRSGLDNRSREYTVVARVRETCRYVRSVYFRCQEP